MFCQHLMIFEILNSIYKMSDLNKVTNFLDTISYDVQYINTINTINVESFTIKESLKGRVSRVESFTQNLKIM